MQTDITNMVRSFCKTDRLHHSVIDRKISNLGLHRAQHFLLMLLSHKTGPVTQRDIAKELKIQPAAVTVKLKKLEADGFITRTMLDGRTNAVEITEKGSEIVNLSHQIFHSIDKIAVKGITEEMYTVFMQTLEIMNTNLQQLLDNEKQEELYEVE